jgi:hypothetical protein
VYTIYTKYRGIEMGAQTTRRINVTFPVSVLEELKQYTRRRERNRFIIEATEKELRRRRLLKALRESAGAWSDKDHPDLGTIEDVNRYVRHLRETWTPRPWEEIAAEGKRGG